MEIILFVAALVVFDVLAHRFGRDSRPSMWDEERRQLGMPIRHAD